TATGTQLGPSGPSARTTPPTGRAADPVRPVDPTRTGPDVAGGLRRSGSAAIPWAGLVVLPPPPPGRPGLRPPRLAAPLSGRARAGELTRAAASTPPAAIHGSSTASANCCASRIGTAPERPPRYRR